MLETLGVAVGEGESRLRPPWCVRWFVDASCVEVVCKRVGRVEYDFLARVYRVLMGCAGRPSTERIDNRHIICTISFSIYTFKETEKTGL